MKHIILIFLFTISSTSLADVFKQVDKDGNVTYSDVPSKATEKPVKVAPITTIKSPPVPVSSSSSSSSNSSTVNYRSLTIVQPTADAVIRANGGVISVTLLSQPALETSSGHKYVAFIDGTKSQTSQSASFSVSNLARGSHSLSVQIQDKDGNALKKSNSINIQILRASVRNRP